MILISVQAFLIPFGLGWIADGGEVESLATEYARIRIWSAPATLVNYCFIGWLIGLQNTRLPMIIMITATVTPMMTIVCVNDTE